MFLAVSEPPRIDNPLAAAETVAKLMKQLTQHIPSQRVALVLDLSENFADNEDAALLAMLPGFGFPPDATDVMLQFNSRKQSEAISGAALNRLGIWRTGKMAFVKSNEMHSLVPFVNCRYDVNTVPEFKIISGMEESLIDEILQQLRVIYDSGVKGLQ